MGFHASRQRFGAADFRCRFVACLLMGAAGCSRGTSDPKTQDSVSAALARRDYVAAQRLASQLSPDDPEWADGQFVLGVAAFRAGDPQTALKHLSAIPRDGSPQSLSAALAAAGPAQSAGQLSLAIELYKYVLEHDPQAQAARGALADLYAATGQRALADRHLRELVKSSDFEFKQLVLLTDYERRHPDEFEFLKKCKQQAPDDPAVNLGLAVEFAAKSEFAAARRHLDSAVARDPQLGAAQALLGERRLDEGDAAMRAWHANLPASVQDDPEIWYVRGLWAQQRGEKQIAARCFWECLREVPHAQRAMYQLGVVMTELDPAVGREFAERAQKLYELQQLLSDMLNRRTGRETALKQVIALLLESGREWEAWNWSIVAWERTGHAPWVAEVLEQLASYPESDAPRILASRDLAQVHDLSHYPGFDEFLSRVPVGNVAAEHGDGGASIRFVDDASRSGIDFVYHQGHVAGMTGVRMQESTGGGVGVLDFDYNRGDETFEELAPDVVGPFFGKKIFGRSLATLDWNHDGRTDFVLSAIGSPAALLTNQTEDAGNFFAIRLRATSTARDAIGTFVTVTTEAGQAQQQLTAGDGYQATNERVLRFGLGREEQIQQIVIVWPGGATQTIEQVPANTRLNVVEGLTCCTLWTGDRPASFDGK